MKRTAGLILFLSGIFLTSSGCAFCDNNPGSCISDIDCDIPGLEYCHPEYGFCVECLDDGDCDGGQVCPNYSCRDPEEVNGQNGSNGGNDEPECIIDDDCLVPGADICDPVSGRCVECLEDDDCEDGYVCIDGRCDEIPFHCDINGFTAVRHQDFYEVGEDGPVLAYVGATAESVPFDELMVAWRFDHGASFRGVSTYNIRADSTLDNCGLCVTIKQLRSAGGGSLFLAVEGIVEVRSVSGEDQPFVGLLRNIILLEWDTENDRPVPDGQAWCIHTFPWSTVLTTDLPPYCVDSSDCEDPQYYYCNPTTGQCVPCTRDEHCEGNSGCFEDECVTCEDPELQFCVDASYCTGDSPYGYICRNFCCEEKDEIDNPECEDPLLQFCMHADDCTGGWVYGYTCDNFCCDPVPGEDNGGGLCPDPERHCETVSDCRNLPRLPPEEYMCISNCCERVCKDNMRRCGHNRPCPQGYYCRDNCCFLRPVCVDPPEPCQDHEDCGEHHCCDPVDNCCVPCCKESLEPPCVFCEDNQICNIFNNCCEPWCTMLNMPPCFSDDQCLGQRCNPDTYCCENICLTNSDLTCHDNSHCEGDFIRCNFDTNCCEPFCPRGDEYYCENNAQCSLLGPDFECNPDINCCFSDGEGLCGGDYLRICIDDQHCIEEFGHYCCNEDTGCCEACCRADPEELTCLTLHDSVCRSGDVIEMCGNLREEENFDINLFTCNTTTHCCRPCCLETPGKTCFDDTNCNPNNERCDSRHCCIPYCWADEEKTCNNHARCQNEFGDEYCCNPSTGCCEICCRPPEGGFDIGNTCIISNDPDEAKPCTMDGFFCDGNINCCIGMCPDDPEKSCTEQETCDEVYELRNHCCDEEDKCCKICCDGDLEKPACQIDEDCIDPEKACCNSSTNCCVHCCVIDGITYHNLTCHDNSDCVSPQICRIITTDPLIRCCQYPDPLCRYNPEDDDHEDAQELRTCPVQFNPQGKVCDELGVPEGQASMPPFEEPPFPSNPDPWVFAPRGYGICNMSNNCCMPRDCPLDPFGGVQMPNCMPDEDNPDNLESFHCDPPPDDWGLGYFCNHNVNSEAYMCCQRRGCSPESVAVTSQNAPYELDETGTKMFYCNVNAHCVVPGVGSYPCCLDPNGCMGGSIATNCCIPPQ